MFSLVTSPNCKNYVWPHHTVKLSDLTRLQNYVWPHHTVKLSDLTRLQNYVWPHKTTKLWSFASDALWYATQCSPLTRHLTDWMFMPSHFTQLSLSSPFALDGRTGVLYGDSHAPRVRGQTVSPFCRHSEFGIYVTKANKRTQDSLESKSLPPCLIFFPSTFSPVCTDWSAVHAACFHPQSPHRNRTHCKILRCAFSPRTKKSEDMPHAVMWTAQQNASWKAWCGSDLRAGDEGLTFTRCLASIR